MEQGQRLKVRCMKPDEVSRVAHLIRALKAHQKMAICPRTPSDQDITKELVHLDESSRTRFPNNRGTYTVVAVDTTRVGEMDQSHVVGYMIYSQIYNMIHGRQFWINSFFIDEEYRRHGLGKKMMEYVRLHAISAGNSRLDVPFMNNNTMGQKFYSNYGARIVNEEYQLMCEKLVKEYASVDSVLEAE